MRRTLLIAAATALLAACATGNPDPAPDPTTPVASNPPASARVAPSPKPSAKPQPAPPVVKIAGDDLVHVGEDVPVGTYRAVTAVVPDSGCYWMKSRDAEGQDIIANDLPAGGRPQVTLKRGEWFTSANCPEWRKK